MQDLRIVVAADLESLATHREAWDRLAAHAPAFSVAQTHGYAEAGWLTRRAGAEALSVVLAYRGEQLAGVWPLQVVRERGVRRVRLLGCGGNEEYGAPLIAAGDPDIAEVAGRLYATACGLGDVLEIYNLPAGSPIMPLLAAEGRLLLASDMSSPVIGLAGAGSWEAWAAAKSRSFRQGLRQDRRRLASRGTVTFREVDPSDVAPVVAWLFVHKRRWLAARGIGASWIRDPEAVAFFTSLAGQPAAGVRVFALDLDGAPVAAGVCLLAAATLEFYVTALDTAFLEYSPGNLLIEDLVRWSIDHGVDFDFRLTRDPYKLRWSDQDRLFTTTILACTPRGRPPVRRLQRRQRIKALRQRIRAMLPTGLGEFLRRQLKR